MDLAGIIHKEVGTLMEVTALRQQEGTIGRKISNSEAASLLGIPWRQVVRIKNKLKRAGLKAR